MLAADLAPLIQGVRRSGDSYTGRCPAHDDQRSSLSFRDGERGLAIKCHAGCEIKDIAAALNRSVPELLSNGQRDRGRTTPKPREVAAYRYESKDGTLLYEAVRFEPKDFRQRRPDGKGGHTWNLNGTSRVLYRLPALQGQGTVIVVEGEKDTDNAWGIGLAATCNSGGAGKWRKEYSEQLRDAGCKIAVIIPDNDPQGRKHAGDVAASLLAAGIRVKVVNLPGLPAKGDLSDWLAAGHTREDLMALADVAPEITSADQLSPGDDGEGEGGEDDREGSGLPVIRWTGGNLPEAVARAEEALLRDEGEPIYQSGSRLVRVVRLTSPSIKGGINRQSGALAIIDADPVFLQLQLSEVVSWKKYDARKKQWRRADAPMEVARALLSNSGRWNLQALTAIIEAPTLRPDGSILDRPGFDAETGLFLDCGNTVFPPIPERPTREEAERSLGLLEDLIRDFPFADTVDKSVALAAILTGVVRRAVRTAPIIGASAPIMGSGKTLLADTIAMISTGRPATKMTHATRPEEEAKSLLTVLMEGDSVVLIDNVERSLKSEVLCAIATSETFKGRVLGSNRTASVSTSALFLITGNNLSVEGDLTTRTLICQLNPETERPEERTFDRNLYEYVPANRGQIVVAALTIIRAYIAAGRPKVHLPTFGRFEEWAAMVRDPLVWLGLPDPAASRHSLSETDPVREDLRTVLSAWHAAFSYTPTTLPDAIERAKADAGNGDRTLQDALVDASGGHAGDINMRKLGRYFSRHMNRIEIGKKIVKGSRIGKSGKISWRVLAVDPNLFPTKQIGQAAHGQHGNGQAQAHEPVAAGEAAF